MTTARVVLVPPRISPSSLLGAKSGLSIGETAGEAMGSTWKLRAQIPVGLDSEAAHCAVAGAFELVVRQMSHWDPASDLCQFNRAPFGTWHELPTEFFEVLERSLAIARESGGACDPTLGELVDLHGFGPVAPVDSLPSEEALARANSRSGWGRLELDVENRRALQPGGCQLDLSSIAKGYAVDLACRSLVDLGFRDFLLELGGEVRGHGCKPDGQAWWASLEGPSDLPETVVALCGLSLATSGDTYHHRIVEGQQISHLIDPVIGSPVKKNLLSVSVLAPHCIDADAWATALYVLGIDRGMMLAETHQLAARFVTRTTTGHREAHTAALAEMAE